jgi:hypothetical protein
MATIEEQLLEYRTEHLRKLWAGQPERFINSLLKELHRMEFESTEDFNTWAQDNFESTEGREASEEELNVLADAMGLPRMKQDTRTHEQKELDDIFKNMSI